MIQTIQTLICRLFPVIGAVCVLFPGPVTAVLPYLLGGAMVLAAAARGVSCRRGRGPSGGSSDGLAHALILLIMGTAFIAQGANALGPMGTTWAIFGIRKASRSLGRAIRQLRGKGRFMAPLLEFLLRITLAMMLLFDPFEKFSAHVVILGLELMATSVRFSKNFLPAWEDWGA